jgi:hypothetical protein
MRIPAFTKHPLIVCCASFCLVGHSNAQAPAAEKPPAAPATAGSTAPPATKAPPPPSGGTADIDTKAIVPKDPPPAAGTPPPALPINPGDAPPVDQLPTLFPQAQQMGPTTNVTVNLLQILVKKGVLTHGEAAGMIEQAKVEAAQAQQALEVAKELAPQDGDVRVTYVPQVVKDEIKESLKADVMAEAKTDGWMAPNEAPEWTQRIKIFGDTRLRFYSLFLDDRGNDNTGQFPNFGAINTGPPYDVAGTLFSPQHNTAVDRTRFQLQARLGFDIDLQDNWTAGMRLVTGIDSSPVNQNQTLGSALNGTAGGNFSKYALWIDRAFIKYHNHFDAENDVYFKFGRFDNPFFSTPLIWSPNVGFDGIAFGGRKSIVDGFGVFLNAGFFPVYNTDFNFPSNQPNKFDSTDKYLTAAQLGVHFKPHDDIEAKFSVAYYDFEAIEGVLSDPYIPLTDRDAGNTDNTRPAFAQRGNTYRPLRDIIPSPINGFGTQYQYQYFGLATPFRELALTGQVDFNMWEPYQLSLIGEYVENLDFDRQKINEVAINNRGADPILGQIGEFEGDPTGWLIRLQFGKPKFEKRGDWSAWIDYRHVGSDSVVDGFNEDDLGGGGTNMKGYTLGAHVALSKNVRVGARWLSAQQLAGPPLKSDIFMFDLMANF